MNPKDLYLLMDISEAIQTERTTIRRYKRGDGKAIHDFAERNGNREHLAGIADDISELKSVDEAEVKALKHSADWVKRDRFVAGVWSDNLFIGEIWIEPMKWEIPSFEIGWFIDKGHEGESLAFEAADACIGFIFNELKAHKVVAKTSDTNQRSAKLADRLGFIREGHERESEIKNGIRYGTLLYGLLKAEKSHI